MAKQKVVTLEPAATGPKRDPYGRLLAYVRLPDGQDLGLVLLEAKICEDFGWKYPHPRGEDYRAVEARAAAR